jgi:hypothetical protein
MVKTEQQSNSFEYMMAIADGVRRSLLDQMHSLKWLTGVGPTVESFIIICLLQTDSRKQL